MFSENKDFIKAWLRVSLHVDDFNKANQLSADNNPIGIEDEEGNEWMPLLAFTNMNGIIINTDQEFKERLGLYVSEYYNSGVSEPYNVED